MSDKVRRVDFHPDEYISGVGVIMRADEQGIYWMICCLIMSEGGPVEYDAMRLGRLCQMRQNQVRKIITKLCAMNKLSLTEDGKLSQRRSVAELERSAERIRKARESGAKGGRPAKISEQLQAAAKADGLFSEKLTTNQQPSTNLGLEMGLKKMGGLEGIALNRKKDAALFEACNLILSIPLDPTVNNHRFPKDIVDLAWANLKETEK